MAEDRIITVCWADRAEPFICAVYGQFTVNHLSEIEQTIKDNLDEFAADVSADTLDVDYKAEYVDYDELGAGWDLTPIA